MAKGSALTECDERMLKAIEMLLNGCSDSEIARTIGVNRKTIMAWKKKDFFKTEWDRQLTNLKNGIENRIVMNSNPMINKLISIALNSKDDKTSLNAIIYCLNRILGTPTKNIKEEFKEVDKKEEMSIDEMIEELDLDNE